MPNVFQKNIFDTSDSTIKTFVDPTNNFFKTIKNKIKFGHLNTEYYYLLQ